MYDLRKHEQPLSWVPHVPKDFIGEVPAKIPIYKLEWEGRAEKIEKMSEENKHHISLLMPCEMDA